MGTYPHEYCPYCGDPLATVEWPTQFRCASCEDWVGEEMLGVYYAVERQKATGPLDAGTDATDARFFTPEEFAASDQRLRPMPNPDETRSWRDLEAVLEVAKRALERETQYATPLEPSNVDV